MKKQELKDRLSAAEEDYDKAQRVIYIEYAKSNNPYKIGDIITDHTGSLKIERIRVSIAFGESECIYEGLDLKANGEPCKKQGRCVYQSNIITTPIAQ